MCHPRLCSALILTLGLLPLPAVHAADQLGRLFTTPLQRAQMNELRVTTPVVEHRPVVRELPPTSPAGPRPGSTEPITIKGLVRRDGGQSTVWVNDSNSYQGDLTTEYLHVDRKQLESGQITLTVPGKEEQVTLKVGSTYLPDQDRIIDVGEDHKAAPAGAESPGQVTAESGP